MNCDIPAVEEAVEIASHQEPIGHFVALVQFERSDMSGVERRSVRSPVSAHLRS